MNLDVAIIVPLAPGDGAWTRLMEDLAPLPPSVELVFAGPEPPRGPVSASLKAPGRWSWLRTPLGRAAQMNKAARAVRRRFVWFLHADSRVSPAGLAALGESLAAAPNALHYFDLAYPLDEGRRLLLNNGGAWIRSHWLGLPFGDQGFCLERERWLALGGFDEAAPYGEDHLLVWNAHRAGLPLRAVGAPLVTSPRKYLAHGWARTTGRHLWLTAAQAAPELVRAWRGQPSLAIAAFVKTPALSPVKTRLAAGIGPVLAGEFYRRSVQAVTAVLQAAVRPGEVEAYWAVAEAAGRDAWESLPVVMQGEGGLGARLATVYEALHQTGTSGSHAAVLIGADAPQIGRRHFEAARARLAAGYDFVLGPAVDGGFYLLAGRRPVPRAVFERVPYSVATTAAMLAAELRQLGRVAWLEPLSDVDEAEDLAPLADALRALREPLPAQASLAAWLAEV